MDLTQQEFSQKYFISPGFYIGEGALNQDQSFSNQNGVNIPDTVDWRLQGAVPRVYSQGSQPSNTYAVLVSYTLDSQLKIKNGTLGSFSWQQLIDCAVGNYFNYVQQFGIANSSEYPNTGQQGACQKQGGVFKIQGSKNVTGGDYQALQIGIVQGTVVASVDATNWQFYKGGILTNCGTNLNHQALAIGYGKNFTILQNTWGTAWGEQGYIRIMAGNTCGVANFASYPIV